MQRSIVRSLYKKAWLRRLASDVVGGHAETQIVALGIGPGERFIAPHGKRPGIGELVFRGLGLVHRGLFPHHLKTLRRGRFRGAAYLDTARDLAGLERFVVYLVFL